MRKSKARSRRSGARRSASWLAFFAAGALQAGCYPKGAPPPPPLSADAVASALARWPGATASELAAGHELFLAKCNGCHNYPDLAALSEDRWPGILDKMAKKAHLSPPERDEVLRFVLAARSPPMP
jgi:mono/diheme cytochrome c family protein